MARERIATEDWGKIRRITLKGTPAAEAWYRDSAGVRRRMRRTGPTPAKAESALRKALKNAVAASDGDLTPESSVSELLTAWWSEWLAQEPAPQTIATYESRRRQIEKGLGQVRLHECTVPRVDRFLKTVKQSKAHRAILRGAFGLAVRHGAMRSNPMHDVAGPPAKPRSSRVRTAAPAADAVSEMLALFRAFDTAQDGRGRVRGTPVEDVGLMMFATGARTNEVLALTWGDIDLESDQPTVTISATLIDDHGTRRQEFPKTENSQRVLYLPQFAITALLRRRIDSYNEKVFPNARGNWIADGNFRRRWWHEALKGSPHEGTVPKAFRKAVATLVAEQTDSRTASRQLGNTESVALKHYIQRPDEGPDVTSLLEAAFHSAQRP